MFFGIQLLTNFISYLKFEMRYFSVAAGVAGWHHARVGCFHNHLLRTVCKDLVRNAD
jgi:hypothetical protein